MYPIMIREINTENISSKRVRKLSAFNEIPFDCWTEIVSFFESVNDFRSIILSVKGLFRFIESIAPKCTKNIEFKVSEIPLKTKNYAHIVSVGEVEIGFESKKKRKRKKNKTFDFDNLTKLLFERFSQITFLSINNYRLVKLSSFEIPQNGVRIGHDLSSLYPHLRKIQLKGKSAKKHLIYPSKFPNLEVLRLFSMNGNIEFHGPIGNLSLKNLEVKSCWGYHFFPQQAIRDSFSKSLEELTIIRSTCSVFTENLSKLSDKLRILKITKSLFVIKPLFVYPQLRVLHLDFTMCRYAKFPEIRFDLFTELVDLKLTRYKSGCVWFRIRSLQKIKLVHIVRTFPPLIEVVHENSEIPFEESFGNQNTGRLGGVYNIDIPSSVENLTLQVYRFEAGGRGVMYFVNDFPRNLKSLSVNTDVVAKYSFSENSLESLKKNIEHFKVFHTSGYYRSALKNENYAKFHSNFELLMNMVFTHYTAYQSLRYLEIDGVCVENRIVTGNMDRVVFLVISKCLLIEKLKISNCRFGFDLWMEESEVHRAINGLIESKKITIKEIGSLEELVIDSNFYMFSVSDTNEGYLRSKGFRKWEWCKFESEDFEIVGCENIKTLRLKNSAVPNGLDMSKIQILD